MTLHTVYTLAGYKTHYSEDVKRTLCGRDVSNGATDTSDMCKRCESLANKLRVQEAVTAEALATLAEHREAEAARECTEGHTPDAGTEFNSYGMCMPCVAEGNARLKAEYAANLIKWQAEADAKRAEEDATMRAQSERMETQLASILAGYSEVTDADLDALAALGSDFAPGPIREAEILRPLTPRVRALVRAEGMVWMNTTPGWTWSSSLYEARKNVLSGRTPGRELNARLMAYDPTGEKAAAADASGRGWDGFMADAPALAHVIQYEGSDVTMCGEPVRQSMGTLRVSVDPTDATCPECISREAELAALDNAPEPSDEECHQEAIREALDARVPDADTMYAAFVAANASGAQEGAQGPRTSHTNPFNAPQIGLTDDARWCGVCKCWDLGLIESSDGSMYVHPDHAQEAAQSVSEWPKVTEDGRTVWACCESTIGAACQHLTVGDLSLSLKPMPNGRILASVGGHTREFADNPTIRMHAAWWAHEIGFRPVKGRAFKWQRSGKISSAPAALI